MIGKKCLKSLLMFGGIMSVLAFGKTALADEVPVIKGDDGKYDISCIVQAPEGSNWITHYFGKVPFEITSVDEKNPKASVENINIPEFCQTLLFFFENCDAPGQLRIIQLAMNEYDRTQKEKTNPTKDSAIG